MLVNRSIPRSTVIPELPYADIGGAIDWLCATLGFTLRLRIADHRAQLNVGDGAVVLIERPPQASGTSYAGSVMVRVDGHRWNFSQSIADVDPRDWGGTPGRL